MKPIKLPKMDEEEIKSSIEAKNLCRIAFIDDEYPYISPFQYILFNNSLYFHFTDYGKKKKILAKNPNVCVSIENFKPNLSKYYFISMQGKLKLVKNNDLKKKVVSQMVKRARENYSENFLLAHGFDKKEGWEHFTAKDQLIYKFELINKPIGLKSL